MLCLFLGIMWGVPSATLTTNPCYEVFFPPKTKCLPKIIKLINGAKKTIYIQCYSFTSKPIAQALLAAKKRGVDVQIITDKSQIKSKGSVVIPLATRGVPIFVDHRVAIAHNKTMTIDARIVMTGSYNWTKAAEDRNAENLIIFYDHPGLIKDYGDNWLARRKASTKFSKQFMKAA